MVDELLRPSHSERDMERAVKMVLIAVENAKVAYEIMEPHIKSVMAVTNAGEVPSKANVVASCAAQIVQKTMATLAHRGIIRVNQPIPE